MTSRSLSGGLAFPIGEKVSLGAKFGYEREQSSRQTSENQDDKFTFTAMHEIPTVQFNLNESTVLLSPDAETDIKKLRKERKFSDLLSFLEKYGMYNFSKASRLTLIIIGSIVFQNTTLGGRLYYTQKSTSNKRSESSETESKLKKSANASLGIPERVEVKVGYSSTKSESIQSGNKKTETADNIMWSGIGGNPGFVVE